MDSFIADAPGPPRRRFYIYRDPADGAPGSVRGWCFVVDEYDASGEPQPLRDSWEETFTEIMRYPSLYADGELVWRREDTGETVDLAAAQVGSDDA